jgi:hypothetical protein
MRILFLVAALIATGSVVQAAEMPESFRQLVALAERMTPLVDALTVAIDRQEAALNALADEAQATVSAGRQYRICRFIEGPAGNCSEQLEQFQKALGN